MQIAVTPFRTCGDEDPPQQTGRAVRVPTARDTILLLRGLPGIGSRLVRTAFVDSTGAGDPNAWRCRGMTSRSLFNGLLAILEGINQGNTGSSCWLAPNGTNNIPTNGMAMVAGERDGSGTSTGMAGRDLLLDASYKYSVNTTRLYLSRADNGRPAFARRGFSPTQPAKGGAIQDCSACVDLTVRRRTPAPSRATLETGCREEDSHGDLGERTARILVVDDDPAMRLLLRQLLEQDGHVVRKSRMARPHWPCSSAAHRMSCSWTPTCRV